MHVNYLECVKNGILTWNLVDVDITLRSKWKNIFKRIVKWLARYFSKHNVFFSVNLSKNEISITNESFEREMDQQSTDITKIKRNFPITQEKQDICLKIREWTYPTRIMSFSHKNISNVSTFFYGIDWNWFFQEWSPNQSKSERGQFNRLAGWFISD